MNALTHGAARVVGVELDPLTVDLIAEREREFTGGIYDRPDVTLHASEGRHFVRSTRDRFDLLQMTGVDTLIDRPRDQWMLFWFPLALLLAHQAPGSPPGPGTTRLTDTNANKSSGIPG